MDREDAGFIAGALESRISSDGIALDQLAASSLMRLSALATDIDRRNPPPGRWKPATVAADQVMQICRLGGKLAAIDLDPEIRAELEIFIAKLRKLAAEPPTAPVNRHQRRAAAKIHLPRKQRIMGRVH